MSQFPIYQIPQSAIDYDLEGTKGVVEKYWIDLPELGRCLFKLEEDGTNGAWVEKITSELAQAIGIPTAIYEFAQLPDGRNGILSPNYLQPNCRERSGKIYLDERFGTKKYLYTIENVLTTIDRLGLTLSNCSSLPSQIKSSSDLFAGYLLFDFLVDNCDRHFENWGIQIDNLSGRKQLLPNYDNGLGLGFLLFEDELDSADPASYVMNQASAFQKSRGRSLPMVELLAETIAVKTVAAQAWSQQIAVIEPELVTGLFQRIPDGWMSRSAQFFAIELIDFNRQQIQSVCQQFT